MLDVTLRQLQMLAATAQTGSLAGAAAALHVTGPAVAQQLRLLEKRAGVPLLERRPEGLVPTEAGHFLVDCAHRVAAEIDNAAESLDALATARTGRVRLGAVSTAKYFVPRIIAAYRDQYPGVTVELVVGNRAEVLTALEDYDVDLVIMGRAPARLDVVDDVFGNHPYVVIAAPDHPLVRERNVLVSRLAQETMLVREPGSGTRLHVEALLEGYPVDVGMEMTSNETIKQAVMANLGVALISAHTVAAELADGRIAALDVEGLPIRRQWRVARLAHREPNPAQRSLWEFIAREGGSLLPA
ncbi:MAG: LysR family transcriptional regulator [Candidatus Nanopelagicales bacterium]|jgi:DNA-binding transcriptional LysR family regulator